MNADRKKTWRPRSRARGFSLVEVVIVLAIAMIISAISLPSFLRSVRTYQLNDAATQIAGVLKFTRYEAIRLNVAAATPLNARVIQSTAGTSIYTDSNNNSTVQSTEQQIFLHGNVNLVASSTPPNTAGLATAAGVAALTNVSITNGSVAFDQRGAVTPAAVAVVYVGNLSFTDLGYRAIIVLPSGSIEIWTTDSSGNWQRLT